MDLDAIIGQLQNRHKALMQRHPRDEEGYALLERELHIVLNEHPEHPKLLYSLGTLYSHSERAGCAIALLEKCIARGIDAPEVWNNLGAAYKTQHKDDKATECFSKALAMCERAERRNAKRIRNGKEPNEPPEWVAQTTAVSYHGLASLYVNAGEPQKCIDWADKALALDPGDRYAAWNRGLAMLELGNWKEGFLAYDHAGFMKGNEAKPIERKLKTYGGLPRWDGTKGQTVVCYGEQGIGDEVMFASMLPDLLQDCKVIIDCDKRLEALFRRSFPQAEAIYPTSDEHAPFPWIANHKPDAYVPMGSLGRYYRPDSASFPRTPFLEADSDKIAKWEAILAPYTGMRVGISWAGGLKATRFDQRTINLARWAEILRVPGIDWFSLQYHPQAPQETADVGRTLGVPIHHWGDMIASYDETAGFLHNLDLVISVCTSLVHLAGSLGVETWCLAPRMVAWRYGVQGPNPFYDSVEMLRQEKAGDWEPILSRVAHVLRQGERRQEAA